MSQWNKIAYTKHYGNKTNKSPNRGLYYHLKSKGGVGEISWVIFYEYSNRTKPLMNFWQVAAQSSGKSESGCRQKHKRTE